MSKMISVNSLEKMIKDNPKKIALLLRTLPVHITDESKRDNPSMKIMKALTSRLVMVTRLANSSPVAIPGYKFQRKNNIPTHGLIGWHILKVCYYKDTVRKQLEGIAHVKQ